MKKLGKIPKTYIFLFVVVLLIVIISLSELNNQNTASKSPSPITSTKIDKLEQEEGDVDVIVEYLPEKSTSDAITFSIVLDTHSVNLDSFDFQKDVFLGKDGRGSLPITVNQSGSGHHRKGEITFKKTEAPFSIVLSNLSGIPKREFQFPNI